MIDGVNNIALHAKHTGFAVMDAVENEEAIASLAYAIGELNEMLTKEAGRLGEINVPELPNPSDTANKIAQAITMVAPHIDVD